MPKLSEMTAEAADALLIQRISSILETKLAVERAEGSRHWAHKRTRNHQLADQVDESLDDGDAMKALMLIGQIIVRTQLVDPKDR